MMNFQIDAFVSSRDVRIFRRRSRGLIVDVDIRSFEPEGLVPPFLMYHLVGHLTDPDEFLCESRESEVFGFNIGKSGRCLMFALPGDVYFVGDNDISGSKLAKIFTSL